MFFWMWEFGLGKPSLGSLTLTEELQIAVRTEACRPFKSTRVRHSSRAPKAEAVKTVKWGGQDIIWWKDWSWDIPMPINCPYDTPWWLKLCVGYRNRTWYIHGITLWKYLYLIYTMYIPEPVYIPCLYHTYTKTQKVIHGECFPLFLHGNSTQTIPHELHHKFPHGCADASGESNKNGSNVYKLNQ